ncbi:MAG: hypothetical protein P8J20_15490 [Novosphingobium sp.]|nr:hypothetical protein [Novosphingobium sp.]
MAHRTPKDLIELYWAEVYNNANYELIREICADPMVRHYPGKTLSLSHEEQIERVRKNVEAIKPRFTHEVLVCDDTYASSAWNMFAVSDKFPEMCSIETFKVVDGRLAECWNGEYGYSLWDSEEYRESQG